MDQLILLIEQNVHLAPYIIFGALLLAGFNLPVSEDLMIIISSVLAVENPQLLPYLFIAVYLGAYFSDLICYGLGRKFGHRLWNIRVFAKMVKREKIVKINLFYKKYGIITLILGRFIPFGVRNGLFLTAGLGKMKFIHFALADLLACTISVSILFTLTYFIGNEIIQFVKKFNLIVFITAILVIVGIWFFKSKKSNSIPSL